MENVPTQRFDDLGIDAEIGNRLFQIKTGVAALRSVRLGLMQLAYAVSGRRGFTGCLVLVNTTVTRKRLQHEWLQATSVLRPEISGRLSLCLLRGGNLTGIPHDPDQKTRDALSELVKGERPQPKQRVTRADASFVILKVLLLQWITTGTPITIHWLARNTGYSYPTVAGVLRGLGSLVERRADRKIRLRWFPAEEFARLVAVSQRTRATVRFADRSGQPRSVESHLRRLEKLNPRGLALGGVAGAKHFFPDFDLVGLPRLDFSLHSPGQIMDMSFIDKLDPALKRIQDPLEPATVVLHSVQHGESFFTPRKGGLQWADPMECLLDLHEAGLQKQASEFLKALLRQRPAKP